MNERVVPRFGLTTGPRVPFQDARREWRWIDRETVIDELWTIDHLAARVPGDTRAEAWTLLAALAADTTRVRVGVLVSPVTLRHPALLAFAAATVDEVTSGRVEVALGAGGGVAGDAAVVQAPDWSARERVDRLDDYVALVDAVLRGEPSYEGRFYATSDGAPRRSAQRPRPPITIASDGRRALDIVARRADRWVSLGGQRDTTGVVRRDRAAALRRTADLNAALDELCVKYGRAPTSVRRAVNGFGADTDPLASTAAFEDYVLGYREVGVTDVMVPLITRDDPRRAVFERVVGEVVPRLRAS